MKKKRTLKKWLKNFLDLVAIYIPVRIIAFFFQILPFSFCDTASRILGNFAYIIFPHHRRLVFKNLDIAFGDKYTEKEKVKICKNLFKEIMNFLEMFQLYKFKDEQLFKMAEIEGEDILKEVLKEKRGVVAISAHMGNFPFALTILCKKGYPVNMIVNESTNVYTERDAKKMRAKFNVPFISKSNLKEAIEESTKWLKKGGILCIYLDQHASNGVECEFFDRKVYVPTGAAVFARKYNTSVIGIYTVRIKPKKHKIVIEGPYNLQKTKNPSEDIRKNTAFFIKRVQEWVEKYPDQWSSWLNDRFPE